MVTEVDEALRQQHVDRFAELFGPLSSLVDASQREVQAHQESSLQAVVQHARTRSAFWSDRLGCLGDRVTPKDLEQLPVLTKAELVEHWDDIVTIPTLTRERCLEHLATSPFSYLDGRYRVCTTGGTTGEALIVPIDWDEFAAYGVLARRCLLRWWFRTYPEATGAPTAVTVMAERGTHLSGQLSWLFQQLVSVSAKSRLAEIVAALNDAQAETINVYPSLFADLATEARAGRLNISPLAFVCGAEPLGEEHRQLALETWDAPVFNVYATTETGLLASSSGFDPGLLLYDDQAVIEAVATDGSPAPVGQFADRLVVTPLHRLTLPLFRYEVPDRLSLLEDPPTCGSSLRRCSDVDGRSDEVFRYGDVAINPHLFRSAFLADPCVRGYRVTQLTDGAAVELVAAPETDMAALERSLTADLSDAGLNEPRVTITRVNELPRSGAGLKLRRFVPLSGSGSPAPTAQRQTR